MTLFDISIIFFFFVVAIKGLTDAFSFWRETDEIAYECTPKHIPAPVRRSPETIKPRSHAPVCTRVVHPSDVKVRPAARVTPIKKNDAA